MKDTKMMTKQPHRHCAGAFAAAALVTLFLPVATVHAQKAKAAKKPTAAKYAVSPGVRLAPGQPAEIGKTYLVGTGASQVNIRVDAVELASEFSHKDLKGKPKDEKIENDIHAWLIVRFTVQNPGKAKLPVWEETWTSSSGAHPPYFQMNAVRRYVDSADGKDSADFFELWEKDIYRESDGKILDTTGPNDKGNWLMPGQSVKAFGAFQIRKEAAPIVTHLQMNYFILPGGGGVGVGDGRSVSAGSEKTLMTFDIQKALGQ